MSATIRNPRNNGVLETCTRKQGSKSPTWNHWICSFYFIIRAGTTMEIRGAQLWLFWHSRNWRRLNASCGFLTADKCLQKWSVPTNTTICTVSRGRPRLGATKQRKTFHLPSNLFAARMEAGGISKQIGRQERKASGPQKTIGKQTFVKS